MHLGKILFFDIDDTLVQHSRYKSFIPPSTIDTIRQLHRNGHKLAIASGRGLDGTRHVMNLLDIKDAVCYNGHMSVEDGAIVEEMPFHAGEMDKLIRMVRKSIYAAFVMGKDKLYAKDDFGILRRSINRSLKKVEGIPGSPRSIEIHKLKPGPNDYFGMIYYNPRFKRQDAFEYLTFRKWGREGYEVSMRGISKLTGILGMADRMGYSRKDIYVFGDNYNDIEMLSGIENSIAMGNGVEEAKKAAAYVTGNVGDGGIRQACDYYGLI